MKKIVYLFLIPGLLSACFSPESETLVVTGTIRVFDEVSAQAEGIVVSIDTDIQEHGHCWINDTLRLPDLNDLVTQLGTRDQTGNFQSTLSSLSPNTAYIIRAYAIVDGNPIFGKALIFKTEGRTKPDGPNTTLITNITTQSAEAFGRLESVPDSGIVTHGHCWVLSRSINQAPPTIELNDTTSLGPRSLPGEFKSQLTNLTSGSTYIIRAYYLTEAQGQQTVVYEAQTETFQTVN